MDLPDINPNGATLQDIMERLGKDVDPTPILHLLAARLLWGTYPLASCVASWRENHKGQVAAVAELAQSQLRLYPHERRVLRLPAGKNGVPLPSSEGISGLEVNFRKHVQGVHLKMYAQDPELCAYDSEDDPFGDVVLDCHLNPPRFQYQDIDADEVTLEEDLAKELRQILPVVMRKVCNMRLCICGRTAAGYSAWFDHSKHDCCVQCGIHRAAKRLKF